MIPTGTHELKLPDGTFEKSCLWFKDGEKVIFKRILSDSAGNTLEEQINPLNPYALMNRSCYGVLKELNGKQDKIKFYFCPKLHPTLDTEEEVAIYLPFDEVVAFKIQGLSSYTSPTDIPRWFIDFLRINDKPIMIHTDYRIKERKDGLDEIIKNNHAFEWAKWAVKNSLKTYLAHGLCLDPLAIDVVNNSDLFMVGVGPDLMLNQERNSLAIQNVDYLTYLFNHVQHKKICFNYDYRWNVHRRGDWDKLDWDSPKRVIACATKLGLSERFLENIFFYNAANFFDIKT